jgi:hypothetical protein
MAGPLNTTQAPVGAVFQIPTYNAGPVEVIVATAGGGPSTGRPFDNTAFVDPTFVGVSNGSLEQPYSTMQAAVDASTGTTHYVCAPATYLGALHVPAGRASYFTLIDYAGQRAELLGALTWTVGDGDTLSFSGIDLHGGFTGSDGAGTGGAELRLENLGGAVNLAGVTAHTVNLFASGQYYGTANAGGESDCQLGNTTVNGFCVGQNVVWTGNLTAADIFLTKGFLTPGKTYTATDSTIGLQQMEFGQPGTVAFVCTTLQVDPYSQWASGFGTAYTLTGTLVQTPPLPPALPMLLRILESGSTNDWATGAGYNDFALKQGGGAYIECDFTAGGTWNAGDILEVEFWCSWKQDSPGPAGTICNASISTDGGATFLGLLPASSIALSADFSVTTFTASGSASIVPTAAPIVRIKLLNTAGSLSIDYGSEAAGLMLRCKRWKAGSYTPIGTLSGFP